MTAPVLRRRASAPLLLTLALALPLTAAAHEGHDDGAAVPAPAPGGGPRFAVASDTFELVGALDGRRLTLWLDRAADNAPVTGATIELEAGEAKVPVQPAGDAYVAQLPAVPVPGTLPIAATITVGEASDLLAAELVVAPAVGAAPSAAARPAGLEPRLAAGTLGVAAVAAVIGWTASRRRRRA